MTQALHATPEDLDATALVATNIAGSLDGLVKRTMTQVDTVLATWQGTAPPAFMQQCSTWQQTMTTLITELNRVGEAAKKSAEIQRTADQDSLSMVNNVQPPAGLKPF
jgi:WXG100 family type VII secretion target